MPDPVDITGQRFGHLTALKFDSRNYHKQARWRCQCDCPSQTQIIAYLHDLVSGRVHSCRWCREIEENAERQRRSIPVPPMPAEAQIQRAKEREQQQQLEIEKIRAAVRRGEIPPAPQIKKSPRHG